MVGVSVTQFLHAHSSEVWNTCETASVCTRFDFSLCRELSLPLIQLIFSLFLWFNYIQSLPFIQLYSVVLAVEMVWLSRYLDSLSSLHNKHSAKELRLLITLPLPFCQPEISDYIPFTSLPDRDYWLHSLYLAACQRLLLTLSLPPCLTEIIDYTPFTLLPARDCWLHSLYLAACQRLLITLPLPCCLPEITDYAPFTSLPARDCWLHSLCLAACQRLLITLPLPCCLWDQ